MQMVVHEASGHDFSRAASIPRKVEGFSPCDVDTFPAFELGKRLFFVRSLSLREQQADDHSSKLSAWRNSSSKFFEVICAQEK